MKRSKEAIAHQTKWEMEEAAKLKAKLDLVETHPKPSYGKLPRKIGVMTCDTGMTLTWAVVEYSGAVELPEQGTRYMRREVDDGKPSDSQTTEKELPKGLIPYSAEREDALKKLREALAQVDRRMIELFRGKPDDVGERMDHLIGNGARLLDVPKEPSRPAKSKR